MSSKSWMSLSKLAFVGLLLFLTPKLRAVYYTCEQQYESCIGNAQQSMYSCTQYCQNSGSNTTTQYFYYSGCVSQEPQSPEVDCSGDTYDTITYANNGCMKNCVQNLQLAINNCNSTCSEHY